jgi:hypothetical protein
MVIGMKKNIKPVVDILYPIGFQQYSRQNRGILNKKPDETLRGASKVIWFL